MRLPLLLLLVACGPAAETLMDAGTDAGQPPVRATDSGALDGGGPRFSCTPGQSFCEGSVIWTCTYSGLDAAKDIDCAAIAAGAFCATACPAGSTQVTGGAISCCR